MSKLHPKIHEILFILIVLINRIYKVHLSFLKLKMDAKTSYLITNLLLTNIRMLEINFYPKESQ